MNAKHISIHAHRPARFHRTYSLLFFGRRLMCTVTSHRIAVRRWIYRTRCIHGPRLHNLVVGLGVQWTPSRRSDPPAATLQLCVGHRCLVFQLLWASSIPLRLKRFLADPHITFVGVGNHCSDCVRLKRDWGLVVANGREARWLAAVRMGTPTVASMKTLAEEVLGYKGVEKPTSVGRSDWDAAKLSDEQVQYACVDAYVAFRIGLKLLL